MVDTAFGVTLGNRPGGGQEQAVSSVKAEARNLNFFYGAFHALRNISLPVYERRVTALIGPSGCGKSTFLRCFNRMHDLYPGNRYEGEIRFFPDDTNLLGAHVDPVQAPVHRAQVLLRVDRDRRVEAGIDDDRPDAGVLDQEGHDRQLDPVLLRAEDAPRGAQLAGGHRHELGWRVHVGAHHRVQHDGGALLPPGKGLRQPAGLGQRHGYASHGLRFEFEDILDSSWYLGEAARHRGSIHSDILSSYAADLADLGPLSVYPASGWWKDQPERDRSDRGSRYALVVTIESP